MKPENVDNIFKKRLHDMETPPPDFVWPNVERELDKRRKRRFLFWIFSGGLALAGLCTTIALNNASQTTFEASPIGKISGQASGANGTSLVSTHSETAQGVGSASMTNFEKQNNTTIAPAAAASVVPEPETNLAQERISKPGKPSFIAKTPRAVGQSDFGKQAGKLDISPESIVNQEFAKDPAPVAPSVSSGKFADRPISVKPQPETTTSGDSKAPDWSFTALSRLPQTSQLLLAPLKMPTTTPRLPIKPFWRKKQEPKNCYDFTGFRRAWFGEISAGSFLTDRNMQTDADHAALLNKRKETETFSVAVGASARAGMMWGPFVFRAGLQYSQFTEIFRYVDPNSVRTIIIRDSVNVNGQWVVTEKTATEYGEKSARIYNRYGLLDIPLSAGAELRFGKIGFSAHAGGAANVLFWKRGSAYSTQNQPLTFTPGATGSEEIYKTNVGLSVMGGLQTYYFVRPNTRLYMEPYYQKILKPITADAYAIQQRYAFWGLNVGLTRFFE